MGNKRVRDPHNNDTGRVFIRVCLSKNDCHTPGRGRKAGRPEGRKAEPSGPTDPQRSNMQKEEEGFLIGLLIESSAVTFRDLNCF